MELLQLSRRQFDRFRDYIYEKSGIRVGENKLALLSNRLRRRLKGSEFEDFDSYYAHLTGSEGYTELSHFLDAITTNETSFFRTEGHFDWFKNEFVNDLVKEARDGRRPRTMRIWSAACATGAEPYTLAVCLWENRHKLTGWALHILGTDISEEALRAAHAGIFEPRTVEAVGERQLRRCFKPAGLENRSWQVRSQTSK